MSNLSCHLTRVGSDDGPYIAVIVHRYLRRNPRMQEHMARCIILRLLLTVRRLHAAGILHLDLKLENVAVDENFGVRILDFGLARCVLS